MGPEAKEDDLPKDHTMPHISEASLWILPRRQLWVGTYKVLKLDISGTRPASSNLMTDRLITAASFILHRNFSEILTLKSKRSLSKRGKIRFHQKSCSENREVKQCIYHSSVSFQRTKIQDQICGLRHEDEGLSCLSNSENKLTGLSANPVQCRRCAPAKTETGPQQQ